MVFMQSSATYMQVMASRPTLNIGSRLQHVAFEARIGTHSIYCDLHATALYFYYSYIQGLDLHVEFLAIM